MEFHIPRRIREKYDFDETLYSYDGNVIFANFHSARVFVQKINSQRDLITYPERALVTSHVNAFGLIDEIFHHMFQLYRENKQPAVLADLLEQLGEKFTQATIDLFFEGFIREYPPLLVHKKNMSPREYLEGFTKNTPNRENLLEELIVLWLALDNPALGAYQDILDEKTFSGSGIFSQVLEEIKKYFEHQPRFGPHDQTLLRMLKTPAIEIPDSITGQLEYIREHWAILIGDYLYRLLSSLDLINEENKLAFTGPGPTPIPVYDQAEFLRAGGTGLEAEAFSQDREWMPRLVLLAKNSYVWLDQLSRKYQQNIRHLDEIPDTELEVLSRWGITGLWLIGLWERSPASARIKQLCGNPEAISSAYSLYSYEIAHDLGGEPAYAALREKAARFGIRLASDMVPNHMGIDSEWLIHHPDRFLALDHCPYPAYSFNGENLSADPGVTIQIEDHYYDRTDAAVVFKRQDNNSGQVKYVYHGNDGTTMPWNDTAQLNYLNPDVREAVIQTILAVARKFPIIRFDAAMTLARKHFQRLWFPQPGSGGAIPSRSEHGMTQEEFNRAMPVEFWREVVDRAAVEAPDTLLLAEAFWLMEGYFVRTLGMHRVYNSAFMNMLRNEDNAGYRKLIKNTLEFEPEILKRYVNFMNNPDEKTAVDQFGKGDKYFGICLLMATMPGLPMIGHGQIEGFSEKYGMEFRKAYWDEEVDQNLVARHEWDIFPLLHQRSLFAGVDNYNFYDFITPSGQINENVFAYTNREGSRSALVIYNNNFQETQGYIHFTVKQTRRFGHEKRIESIPLVQALDLPNESSAFLVFRDQVSRLEYIRPISDIVDRGLQFKIRCYQYFAFVDFRVVLPDTEHDYRRLYEYIGNQGVPDIDQALNELFLRPIQEPFSKLINYGYLSYLIDKYQDGQMLDQKDKTELDLKVHNFIEGMFSITGLPDTSTGFCKNILSHIIASIEIAKLHAQPHLPESKKSADFIASLLEPLMSSRAKWFTLISWAASCQMGTLSGNEDYENLSSAWIDEWQLSKTISELLSNTGAEKAEVQQLLLALKISITQQNWYENSRKLTINQILHGWLSDPYIQNYLHVNRYQEVLWYNREAFNDFIWWMSLIPMVKILADPGHSAAEINETIMNLQEIFSPLVKADSLSGYKLEKLVELLEKGKSK